MFQRHIREKGLNRPQASKLRQAFEEDVQNGVWILVPVSNAVLKNVEAAVRNLAPHVYLRAADAIHLVTARDAGFSEIWSNDRHLLRGPVLRPQGKDRLITAVVPCPIFGQINVWSAQAPKPTLLAAETRRES